MADNTPNYNFILPTDGADSDLWGGYLNANWSDLDTLLKTMNDAIDANAQQISALSDAIVAQRVPIGFSVIGNATNPGDAGQLGYGTWIEDLEGRALVGVGDNGEQIWAADEERGSEVHTLVDAEMPAHTHGDGTLSAASAGSHNHTQNFFERSRGTNSGDVSDLTTNGTSATTSTNGAHTHDITGNTGSAGSDASHNNVQPSKAKHIWTRTA